MARRLGWRSAAVCVVLGVAAPAAVRAAGVVVDHTTTDAGGIPSSALDAARALTMSFSHASVGAYMWQGLGLLEGDDSDRYAFPSWEENDRGNPGWQLKISRFETWVSDHASGYQVFLNKFCYIDQDAGFADYRDSMVGLQSAYPAKTFVWFTMPLKASGTDNALRAAFNAQVRSYASAHGVPLFDIADIESHLPDGTAVTSDGHEAMATAYCADCSSGGAHPNEVGERRLAGAMWQLMARLGGWSPAGAVCGNGTCETGETAATCAADCSSSGGGSGSSSGGGCGSAGEGGAGAAGALLAALLLGPSLRRRARARARA